MNPRKTITSFMIVLSAFVFMTVCINEQNGLAVTLAMIIGTLHTAATYLYLWNTEE